MLIKQNASPQTLNQQQKTHKLLEYYYQSQQFWEMRGIDKINIVALQSDQLLFKKIKAMMFPHYNDCSFNETAYYELEFMLFYLYSVKTHDGKNRLFTVLEKIIKGELKTYLDVITFIILYANDSTYYSRVKSLQRFDYLINKYAQNKMQVQLLRALYIDSGVYGKTLMPSFPTRLRQAKLPDYDDLKVPEMGLKELYKSTILNSPVKRINKDNKKECSLNTINNDLSDDANYHLARRKIASKTDLLSFYTRDLEPFATFSEIGSFCTFNYSTLWFSEDVPCEVSTTNALIESSESFFTVKGKTKEIREQHYYQTLKGCDFKKVKKLQEVLIKEGIVLQENVTFEDSKHVPALMFVKENLSVWKTLFSNKAFKELQDSIDVETEYNNFVKQNTFKLTMYQQNYYNSESILADFNYKLYEPSVHDYSDYENYLHNLYVSKLEEKNTSTENFINKVRQYRKNRVRNTHMYIKRGNAKNNLEKRKKYQKQQENNQLKFTKNEYSEQYKKDYEQTYNNKYNENDWVPTHEYDAEPLKIRKETEYQKDLYAYSNNEDKNNKYKLDKFKTNVFLNKYLPMFGANIELSDCLLKVMLNTKEYNYTTRNFQTMDLVTITYLMAYVQYKNVDAPWRPHVLLPTNLVTFLGDNKVQKRIEVYVKACEKYGFDPLTVLSFMSDKKMKSKYQSIVVESKAVYPLNQQYFKKKKELVKNNQTVKPQTVLSHLENLETRKILDVESVTFNYDLFLHYGDRIVKTLAHLIKTDYELKMYLQATKEYKTELLYKLTMFLLEECSDLKCHTVLFYKSVNELANNEQAKLLTLIESAKRQCEKQLEKEKEFSPYLLI